MSEISDEFYTANALIESGQAELNAMINGDLTASNSAVLQAVRRVADGTFNLGQMKYDAADA